MSTYDSTADTLAHIRRVNELLLTMVGNLLDRAAKHDASKLVSPEKEIFDVCTVKLREIPYGSPEYTAALAELKPALEHHYARNRHHPEHHVNGVDDMTLLDLVEMLADWKAASERMKGGGSVSSSIEYNSFRFKLSPQLKNILFNTARELHWTK